VINRRCTSRGTNAGQHLISLLAVVASLAFPVRVFGQERVDPIAATVAQWFTMIEQSFVALADAMPADKYAFKPTDGEFKDVRTFGEQVKHVACSNFGFFNEIEKKAPPEGCGSGGPHPATTKDELMTYLRESFAYAGRVIRTMTPANALEPAGGPYGGTSTRLGLTTLAVWHASDHYGQLAVYLRMNRIVPPGSRPVPAEATSARAATVFKDGGAYGTVTRVELPFGNLDTSFLESDVRSIGVAAGDAFQVRCREKAFDIILGRNFGDVPRGEWVALISLPGTLKIARSFASAAEASGCKAGDSVFIAKRSRVK
jgi:DinB family protein/S-adenosylmethionine hydroxide adenosyltransferase-like protein